MNDARWPELPFIADLPPLKWSSLRYGFDHGGYDGEEEAYG